MRRSSAQLFDDRIFLKLNVVKTLVLGSKRFSTLLGFGAFEHFSLRALSLCHFFTKGLQSETDGVPALLALA